MENILKKIIIKKKERISKLKVDLPINTILDNIKTVKNLFNFKDALIQNNSKKKISIIAEIKKSSPSAGILVENFDIQNIAKLYVDNGATGLSVLTEEDFFEGKLEFIETIKKIHKIPILCKDFFVDTYQVPLAKSFGADCVLIILSAIDKFVAHDIYQAACDLNLSTIVEVHTEKEAEEALYFENSIIGINNRNLKTLEISLENSIKLSKIVSSHKNPLISESGIHSPKEVRFIIDKAKIPNFLIGESLLTCNDISSKMRDFVEIKL
jgi:indole-3-glycerol phosphate synthase